MEKNILRGAGRPAVSELEYGSAAEKILGAVHDTRKGLEEAAKLLTVKKKDCLTASCLLGIGAFTVLLILFLNRDAWTGLVFYLIGTIIILVSMTILFLFHYIIFLETEKWGRKMEAAVCLLDVLVCDLQYVDSGEQFLKMLADKVWDTVAEALLIAREAVDYYFLDALRASKKWGFVIQVADFYKISGRDIISWELDGYLFSYEYREADGACRQDRAAGTVIYSDQAEQTEISFTDGRIQFRVSHKNKMQKN